MSKIFISYRREDSADVTGRIYDYLCRSFKADNIFKDVDNIPPGSDFRTVITNTVQACDVALVIIGRDWLTATNRKGNRQLDDPDDFVRLEIEGALKRKIPLIPVLVRGAELPTPEDLPESLKDLVFRNAIQIRPDPDFKNDVGRLVRALKNMVKGDGFIDGVIYEAKIFTRGQVILLVILLVALGAMPYIPSFFEPDPAPNINGPIVQASPSLSPEEDVDPSETATPLAPTTPAKVVAYDPTFLGSFRVPLPEITDEISKGDLLNGQVFDYMHYSLVINERRAMPLYTASNIDGALLINIRREGDQWKLDSRVPRDLQRGNDVYVNNDWDRGHVVPRSAMAWGSEEDAKLGAESVFFFPNTVPQHKSFNQGIWSRLETHVLNRAKTEKIKMSVFAGPVFRSTDYEYRGIRIPQSFWKIVCELNSDNSLSVSAYLMDQYTLTSDGKVQTPDRITPIPFNPKNYQVSVEKIESLTPLQFGTLKQYDTYQR